MAVVSQTSNILRQLLRSRCVSVPIFCLGGQTQVRYVKRLVRERLQELHRRKEEEERWYPKPETPRFQYSDWNYGAEIFAFGKRLGETFDEDILRQAFTDRSYALEQMKKQEELGLDTMQIKDNENLSEEGEILARETLAKCLKEQFPKFPTPGAESVVNYLMNEPILANISSSIGTKDLILSNEYPPTETTFARTFLAIIGALAKSSDAERAQRFVRHFILTQLWDKDINEIWDIPKPWRMLVDIMNQKGETFEPRLLRESGRNEILSVFVIGLYDSSKKLIGTGTGETLDIAQEMASRDALAILFGTKDTLYNLKFN